MHERNGKAAEPARPWPPAWRRYAVPGAIAIVGVVLVLVSTWRWGAALSPDSAYYISAARNLLAGRGLTCFDGGPLVDWPPLFPLLLAGLGKLGIEPLTGARFLNALTFGTTVFLTGVLLAQNVRDRALVAIGTAAVMVSNSFFGTAVSVWTEPVFALLLALIVLFLGRFAAQGRMLDFIAVVLLTALAPLQRYMGVTMIPATALAIMAARELPLRRRAGYSVALCLLSPLPLVLWLARNLRLSGTLTGERPGTFAALGPSALALGRTVLDWLLPGRAAKAPAAVCIASVLAMAALIAFLARSAVRQRNGTANTHVRFALIALTVYAALLLAAGNLYNTQYDRYMAPVFFLVVLLLAVAAERIIAVIGRRSGRRKPVRLVVLAVGILLLITPILHLAEASRRIFRNGTGGFESPVWRQFEVTLWLKANPLSGKILSNQPAAVYILTGDEARMSPRLDDDPARLLQTGAVASGDFLVWFGYVHRPYLMLPAELNRQFGLRVLATTADGCIAVFR